MLQSFDKVRNRIPKSFGKDRSRMPSRLIWLGVGCCSRLRKSEVRTAC